MESKFYNTHHSAFGSYFSFIMGKEGAKGGFVLNDVKSPNNNIYIGYKKKNENLNLMPYFERRERQEDQFVINEVPTSNEKVGTVQVINEESISRELNWASDTFKTGDLEFKLITAFKEVKNPAEMTDNEIKLALLPAIFGEISFDNTSGDEEVLLVFGVEGVGRLLSETTNNELLGGARDRRFGFACRSEDSIEESIGWAVPDYIAKGERSSNKLGTEVALTMKVPAGTKKSFVIALAAYREGCITSGMDASFGYAKYFKNLEEVLEFALEKQDLFFSEAETRDNELLASGLNEYRRFNVSQATHSYYANTELLINNKNEYVWVVNEGEYLMMNTFDLTIDQMFLELKFHPWTVKNNLDLYLSRYSYIDSVKDIHGNNYKGGISFTHDMGIGDMFSPKEYSSYERENISGCFSYMTSEQLLNWILCGSCYGINNDYKWLVNNKEIFVKCLESLKARALNETGIIDTDSLRCKAGTEITTYDSLDISLGQSRNNLYLGVKTWAAYVCLQNVFQKLDMKAQADNSCELSFKVAHEISSKFDEEKGFIPAVFENGNNSAIIPAVEGLIYPFIINDLDAVDENGRFKAFINILTKHTDSILKPGICIDSTSGGWKLSSTSNNTWLSKIFLCQVVIQKVLKMDYKEQWAKWDEIHAEWLTNSCSELCAVDQVYSEDGRARGSRLYPRLVTNILWL
ncbi:MAG: xylan 1,4-beta-xylosidase [Clostridiaceae bacterium]|nr:xylan 1,4-beta-xylosidase [Clostridiaceae bacterium]